MTNFSSSPKDRPKGLFQCHYEVVSIQRLPTGGFAVPMVDGKYIINNSSTDTYVCNRAGHVFRIPPLNDETREILIRQLYDAVGAARYGAKANIVNIRPNEPGYTPFHDNLTPVNSGLSLEPPYYFLDDDESRYLVEGQRDLTFRQRLMFGGGIKGKHHLNDSPYIPFFTQTNQKKSIIDRANMGETDAAVIYNDWQSFAGETDQYFELTRMLRQNISFIGVFEYLFTEELECPVDKDNLTIAKHVAHANEGRDNGSLLSETFSIRDTKRKEDILPNRFFGRRDPCIVYEVYQPSHFEQGTGDVFMPQYGFTIAKRSDIENRAMNFHQPLNDDFISRFGFRIVVDSVIPSGKVYAKFGHMVFDIVSTRTSGVREVSNTVYVYGTDMYGQERLLHSIPWEIASRDGIRYNSGGNDVAISFHATRYDAHEAMDAVSAEKWKEWEAEKAYLVKEYQSARKEFEKVSKEKEKLEMTMKEKNSSFWSAIISKPLAAALSAAAGAAVTLAIKALTSK